jgi:hypothetical protein
MQRATFDDQALARFDSLMSDIAIYRQLPLRAGTGLPDRTGGKSGTG